MGAVDLVRDGYVSVEGLRLHYRERGDRDAPDVLILHGLTGHAWEFDPLAEALSQRFHVVQLNQRGHGESGWASSYQIEDMVEDARGVIETLGLTSVRLIGHSMGGINAWSLAARYPELIDRIAVLDIGPDSLDSSERRDGWLERLEAWRTVVYPSPEHAVSDYLGGPYSDEYPLLRTFVLDNIHQLDEQRWTWRFDAGGLKHFIETVVDTAEQLEVLQRVQCPALFIRAGDSGILGPDSCELIIRAVPQARCIEIAGSGHDLHFDQPEALLTQLRCFIDAG
jgi:esterase